MASREKDDAKGFLSRWSQRKQAAAEDPGEPERAAAQADAAQPGAASQGGAGEVEPIDPAELPEIDSLDVGSDFSVFMKQGVPQALKQRALRRLWQVDPAFHEICMLDDYNLDYTDAATVVPNLKTLYQVGKGIVLEDEVDAGQEAAAAESAGPQDAAGAEAPPSAAAPSAPTPADADAEGRASRAPRRPGTPRVAVAATPRPDAPSRPSARSARQRRWGEPDGQ